MMDPRLGKTLRKGLPVVLAVGSLGILSSASIARAQDANQDASAQAGQRTDGQIEMDVVHALDAEAALKQDWITAGTVQGEVTLSGTSGSAANRQLAESVAGKVPGVTKVVDNLKVGDPQTAAQDNMYPGQDQPDSSQYAQQVPDQGQPNQGQPNQGQPNQGQQSQNQQGPGYGDGGPAPQQPGARPQYRPVQPNYQTAPPPQMAQGPEPPHPPVTVAQGSLLKVRTSETLNSKFAKVGTPVEFTVVRDVYAGGVIAIPRGAVIHGEVTEVKQAGAVGGNPELALKLDALDLGGTSYPLSVDPFQVKGPNKAGHTVGSAIGGAFLGALIGGAVGGGGGAAIGAGAGAVGGTAASAATPGPRVWIPAEAMMDFHLNAPITVTPVTRMEAQRLAGNALPPTQRPTLYQRGYYPYGYPPPPPPGYYYRPY